MYPFTPINEEPKELQGRFNSIIVTAFDDSMTVEMQIRSYIKLLKETIKLTNEQAEYLNEFIKNFDTNLNTSVTTVLDTWLKSGVFDDILMNTVLLSFKQELEQLQVQVDNKITKRENESIYPEMLSKSLLEMITNGSIDVNVNTSMIQDRSVTPNKTSYLIPSINLWDKTLVQYGYYIDYTGNKVKNDGYMCIEKIPIDNSKLLRFKGLTDKNIRAARYITEYDYKYDAMYDKGLNNPNLEYNPFSLSNQTKFVSITFPILYNYSPLMVYQGDISPYVESGIENLKNLNLSSKQLLQLETTKMDLNKLVDPTKKLEYDSLGIFYSLYNVLNPFKVTKGYYINPNGTKDVNSDYYFTDYILLNPNETIKCLNINNQPVHMRKRIVYALDKKTFYTELGYDQQETSGIVSSFKNTTSEPLYVVLSLSISKYGDPENVMIYKGEETKPFQKYEYQTTEEFKLNSTYEQELKQQTTNVLKDKRITIFGTSISYGHSASFSYGNILSEKYGCIVTNLASNGATLTDIYKEILNSNTEPDVILFDGGANDNNVAVNLLNLGALTTSYTSTFDDSTIYGKIEKICQLLYTKYPNSKKVFVNVHKMPTRPFDSQEKVSEALLNTMKKWSISVVDIYNEGSFNTNIDYLKTTYTFDPANGTHPNKKGYEKFYVPLIKDVLIKCIES